jgi:nucleoside-diphosphate-sugar epimerase
MSILITGAAGFLGHQLWKALEDDKIQVVGIDNLSSKPVIKPHKKLIKKNVQSVDQKFLIKHKIKTIFHFAAKKNVKNSFYNLNESTENYDMTLKLLDACNGSSVKKIFIASTCEIFGYQNKKLNEKSKYNPFSPYAVSKVAIEYLIDVYSKLLTNIKITSLVFFNTYGPTEGTDAVIPNFISKAIKNQNIIIEGDGLQARDFTYISDTIDTLLKIHKQKKYFRKINIGSGKDVSIKFLSKYIIKNFPKVKIIYKKKRPNEIKTFLANNTLIKKKFSFKSSVKINEGLDRIIKFYGKN